MARLDFGLRRRGMATHFSLRLLAGVDSSFQFPQHIEDVVNRRRRRETNQLHRGIILTASMLARPSIHRIDALLPLPSGMLNAYSLDSKFRQPIAPGRHLVVVFNHGSDFNPISDSRRQGRDGLSVNGNAGETYPTVD